MANFSMANYFKQNNFWRRHTLATFFLNPFLFHGYFYLDISAHVRFRYYM
jgi:hypothetical protein